jgi:hypothetical protein
MLIKLGAVKTGQHAWCPRHGPEAQNGRMNYEIADFLKLQQQDDQHIYTIYTLHAYICIYIYILDVPVGAKTPTSTRLIGSLGTKAQDLRTKAQDLEAKTQ